MGCHGLGKSPKKQPLFPGLLVIACLVSCGEEDRIVKVTCDPASKETISIQFNNSQPASAHISELSIYHFSPGTILQLAPGESPEQLGRESVAYALKPPADRYFPAKSEILFGTVTNGHFKIEVDGDVEREAVDLEEKITKNTAVYYYGAVRKMLRDSLAVINADNIAVKTIRDGPTKSRFVVVSGVWSGGQVFTVLNDSSPFIAINTLKSGRFYLHLSYACFPSTAIRSEADSAQTDSEFLFSYLPVEYDGTEKAVILDVNPIDLTKFVFAEDMKAER